MEDKTCYVYTSESHRPSKKPRVSSNEFESSAEIRLTTYYKLWSEQEQLVQDEIREAHVQSAVHLEHFIASASSLTSVDKLPSCFLITGSDVNTVEAIFQQIQRPSNSSGHPVIVHLCAADVPNIKTFLKHLIKKTTSPTYPTDDFDELVSDQDASSRLLNYDLQILYEWQQAHRASKLIVVIRNSEAFDASVLADAVTVLHLWRDRLPFVLVFGVATSIELFQDRLPNAVVSCLAGISIEVVDGREVAERLFKCLNDPSNARVRMGPSLAGTLLQKSKDSNSSTTAILEAAKYAYMCHFYANPLSVFLAKNLEYTHLDAKHFEAARNLDSFRNFVELLVQAKQVQRAKALLHSNSALFAEIKSELEHSQHKMTWTLGVIDVVIFIQEHISYVEKSVWSSLYPAALSGKLYSSTIVREILLFIKKAPSNVIIRILPLVSDHLMGMPPTTEAISPDDFRDLQEQLQVLIEESSATDGILRSEHDIKHETLRTTIVAQRVELSSKKSKLSEDDSEYSKIVVAFHDLLENYFQFAATPVHDLFLHEVFVYDLKSTHREAFDPRPRFAIERALSSPHDYLGCRCCQSAGEGLGATQPPTALLYQLYLESGPLINTYDLWSAFLAVVGEQHNDEQTTMAYFFQGLAEMKQMGYIKHSRKKVDHLAKLAWKGL